MGFPALARLVGAFFVVPLLLVVAFLLVAEREAILFALDGPVAFFVPARVFPAAVFFTAVEARLLVEGAVGASLLSTWEEAFLRATRRVAVPSCLGFSAASLCTAMTSL